jgi:hypothetical protein
VKYLRKDSTRPLVLGANNDGLLMWYVNALFAVHPNVHGHTGGGLTLGRGTFRLGESLPTTTLLSLAPQSTQLLRRNYTTLTKYNLLSSIIIRHPPLSNKAQRYQQNHLTTSGCSCDSALAGVADKKSRLGRTSSSRFIVIVLTSNQKNTPRATIEWCAKLLQQEKKKQTNKQTNKHTAGTGFGYTKYRISLPHRIDV